MEIKISTDELVSVVDAAKTLGWPKMRIYRWVDADKLVGVKLGGILFIPSSEVERLKHKEDEAQEAGH